MTQQNFTALVVGQGPNAQSLPTGPTWGRLFRQRHDDYDADLWLRLRLLHEGGFAIQKHAHLFIDKAPEEPEKYYKWRLRTTAYVNHMARVIGYLIGGLFGVPLKVSPPAEEGEQEAKTPDDDYYKGLATNCDLRGTDFSQFMRARLVDALVQKRALVGVDMPPGVAGAVNRAQEDAMGAGRGWFYEIPLESMLDWEKDDRNRYKWCKIVKKVVDRSDPLADHSSFYFEFKIWRLDGEGDDARAAYEVYRTKIVKDEKDLKDEDDVPLVQELTFTSFPRIPILEMDLPAAVWAGNQLGPLCTEHYNGRSDLRGSLCRNLVEIPYVKLGPEIPEVHGEIMSVTQQDPSRGDNMIAKVRHNGFMKIGSDDEIGFAGPSGSAFQMGAEENGRVRDEIYSAMNTMALALANTASTVQRSGESKKEDRSATTVILDYLGGEVREIAEMLYDIVSAGRAEKDAEWVASGVDSFDEDDLATLIEEAAELELIPIPSKTLQIERKTALAMALVSKSSQAVKSKIVEEIKAGMTDDLVLPPKPPLPVAGPGKGPPGAKPPAKPPVKA